MKRFIRTFAGKAILFMVCIASVCVLAASALCIYLCFEEDVYIKPEQELLDTMLERLPLRSDGYSILWKSLYGKEYPECEYSYRVVNDKDGTIVSESVPEGFSGELSYSMAYGVVRDGDGNAVSAFRHNPESKYDEAVEYYTVCMTPIAGTEAANRIELVTKAVRLGYSLRYAVYFIALAALIVCAVSFVALMCSAGRRPDSEELYHGPLTLVPYDLLLALCCAAVIGMFFLGDAVTNSSLGYKGLVIAFPVLCLLGLNMALGVCVTTAVRIKERTLLKNTVIWRVIKAIGWLLRRVWNLILKLHRFNCTLIRRLPLIWKAALGICGIALLNLLVTVGSDGDQQSMMVLWAIETVILVPALLYGALCLKKLQKSGAALAAGDLSYHTETKGMIWDLKDHGENLNSIASGMARAVDERLKSERMKTELITNVSHDIKTPLTSVINYASLIGNEPCDNPKIAEYSSVLVRQSEKLKRLIDDLVEASKASTGNLEVLLAPCDAAVFLTQAGGEYEEKLRNADLTLVTRQPEKELRIMADGRRMWRIFDNLMNNICKYAQPGTRVYLSLEEKGGSAVITFKNTSREPLDMSEDELMERFTRGDSSRNTDGNGLGLSIAGSLAELQGGSLRLAVDGDLFKAILAFPLI